MNTKDAQPVIIGALALTAGLSVGRALTPGKHLPSKAPSAVLAGDDDSGEVRWGRILTGSLFTGILLMGLAQVEPGLAAGLAGLIALTSVIGSQALFRQVASNFTS